MVGLPVWPRKRTKAKKTIEERRIIRTDVTVPHTKRSISASIFWGGSSTVICSIESLEEVEIRHGACADLWWSGHVRGGNLLLLLVQSGGDVRLIGVWSMGAWEVRRWSRPKTKTGISASRSEEAAKAAKVVEWTASKGGVPSRRVGSSGAAGTETGLGTADVDRR